MERRDALDALERVLCWHEWQRGYIGLRVYAHGETHGRIFTNVSGAIAFQNDLATAHDAVYMETTGNGFDIVRAIYRGNVTHEDAEHLAFARWMEEINGVERIL